MNRMRPHVRPREGLTRPCLTRDMALTCDFVGLNYSG